MIYDEDNFPDLPSSWCTVTVDNACTNLSVTQKVPTKHYLVTGNLPVVDQGAALIGGYTNDDIAVTDKLPVIVFGDHTRILKYIEFHFAAGADGIKVLAPNELFLPRAFFRFVQGIKLPDRGYSRHFQFLRRSSLPFPPLNEQKRIADKLDAVLARVDACRDRLDRIPVILKRFRQSVLAAATLGMLTVESRGSDISSWSHERAADICTKVQSGGTPREGFSDEGIPFLKVYNIVDQKVAFDYKPQYISLPIHLSSMSKSQAQPGDVLMNIVGPPLGKVAIVPDYHPAWNINQAITLFRPSERISTGWLYCILCGGENIAEIIHETKGSAGQTNISLSQCRDFIFPVPSMEEQTEIVRRVESLFAYADRLEARYTAARAQVEKLTPALLAKAFRGELVPQDPSDEPAGELLARIAAARETTATIRARKPTTHKTIRAPRENAAMTKSRQDGDNKDKP